MLFFNSLYQKFTFVLILLLAVSCGGIKMINKKSTEDLYSPQFLKTVEEVKAKYSSGQTDDALVQLREINDVTLNPTELASRNNLMGVILFSKGDFQNSVAYFQQGLKTSSEDYTLTAQLNLNLGSSFFKLEEYIKAYSVIKLIDERNLADAEKPKYFKLFYFLANEIGDHSEAIRGLVKSFQGMKSIKDVRQNQYYDSLNNLFEKLSKSEKIRLLEEHSKEQNIAAALLGYNEIQRLLFNGQKEYANDFIQWLEENYSDQEEVIQLLKNFDSQLKIISKIDTKKIGLILPFSGSRANFSKRSLLGIDFAVQRLKEQFDDVEIIFKDSQSSGAIGSFRVRQLVEQHSVSAIIGGLFSDEARDEYLEARKYGVLFISLSQIYLPRDQKNNLLIEVPGSVESQVESLFSKEMVESFGSKVALLYPKTDRGNSYLDEVWAQAENKNIQIVGVQSYEKGLNDYRDVVSNLLGLKMKRQRKEEFEFLEEIHSLQEKSAVRRIQTLPPTVSFDWVFAPAYPNEAIQIVPSFAYYDAFKIKFFGDPSWRSKLTQRISSSNARLYFMGDKMDMISGDLVKDFSIKYKRRPGLVELISYDAVQIFANLSQLKEVSNREKFNEGLRNMNSLEGITGGFVLKDNLWVKELMPLELRRGSVRRVNLEAISASNIAPSESEVIAN